MGDMDKTGDMDKMGDMDEYEKGGSPPSYEESISNTHKKGKLQTAPGNDKLDFRPFPGQQVRGDINIARSNLSIARHKHIRDVVHTKILPTIEQQAQNGIARTTMAIFPGASLSSVDQWDLSEENSNRVVVGLSSGEEPHIVFLDGQMDKSEFWTSPSVLSELETVTRGVLSSPEETTSSSSKSGVSTHETSSQSKQGVLRRMREAVKAYERPWTGNRAASQQQKDGPGQVSVKVKLEEVTLRTLSDFGLYNTVSQQCVVLETDLGC